MSHAEMTGGCACGAIRFKITAPFIATGACHCTDCQKASGGGPNYVGLAPKDAFVVTKGKAKLYVTKSDNGTDATRAFCPDCGTPLWSELANAPLIPVKVGALDDGTGLAPKMHIYVSSAPSWHHVTEGAPVFPKMPPAA